MAFEERADGGGGEAFSEGGNDAAGDEDVFCHSRLPYSFEFHLLSFYEGGEVGLGVDAGGGVKGDGRLDAEAHFEGAELFEFFKFFEARLRRAGELKQRVAPVCVKPQVPVDAKRGEIGGLVDAVADKGDGGAREIERV